MKSGESIRESFKLYLNNPAVILPYFLVGIFNIFAYLFTINLLKHSIATLRFSSTIELLVLGEKLNSAVSAIFLKNILFILAMGILYLLVDALLKSYTIGLSSSIVRGKGSKLSSGFASIKRTFSIFWKNIIVGLLLLFGFALIFVTSSVLLGRFALIAFIPASIIYTFIVFAITLFASQSIVLEKKGAWSGIASAYFFVRKHIEEVAKLVLFIIFVFVAFQVIKLASLRLFGYFFSSTAMFFISNAENLLLGYILMRPFFVILKTHFFIKNSKNFGQKEAKK